jgi:pimeloyl-ACP methyl ester carboxylesterase
MRNERSDMQTDPHNAPPTNTGRLRSKLLIAIAAAATLTACTAFAVCWRFAESAVAPAHFNVGAPPLQFPAESIELESESGATIAGWYVPAHESRGVVVLAHPIRGSRRTMLERAKLFHEADYSVVLIDLRGHGESTGDSITLGFLEQHDVRAAVDFARSRHPHEPIAVDGWSLGGAAALMASPLDIDAMIIEAVYPTIAEAVENRTRMRVGPLGPLAAAILLTQLEPKMGVTADQLRPIDRLANVKCPVLFLAGSDDLHTTAAQTQRMFDRAQEPKQCVIFNGAAHVDLQQFDSERYRSATLDFLDAHMCHRAEATAAEGSSD